VDDEKNLCVSRERSVDTKVRITEDGFCIIGEN